MYSLLPSPYHYVSSPVPTSTAATPAMSLKISLPIGEKPPDKFGRGDDAIPTQASLGIAFPIVHQIPEEHSMLQPSALTSTAHPCIVVIWYFTGLPPRAHGHRFMLVALKPRIPGHRKHYPPGATLPTHTTFITTPTTPCSSIVRLFIFVIWYATGLPPSVVGQRFMLVALNPRLPGNWKQHDPYTSLTTLATTNTTATASCISIVRPLVISFLIDIDISLLSYVCDRSLLVASTHCCQHPSNTTTYISNVHQVPPPLLTHLLSSLTTNPALCHLLMLMDLRWPS